VQDAGGIRWELAFDAEDRVTNRWDANGLSVGMTYDGLGRLLSRWYPDGGVEDFGYSTNGLVAYTNQLGKTTYYTYDAARRKTAETNANLQVTQFSYDAAGDLLTLTDGKNQTTTWGYDQYGRVTNKLDQAGSVVLAYTYDPDNRLTNRWSAAKANTGYAYDPVGNLTNIAYPSSGTVKFAYDVLNRLTNMVDSLGTTRYSYDAAGQLLTEGGLFTSDTVTNTYGNRRRVGLSLQQPTGLWTNGFGWDLAGRLTNVTSPAGAFGYTYTPQYSGFSGRLVQQLSLPNGAAVTNLYDPVARLLNTVLRNSSGTTIDAAYYGYNVGNQRTAYTNAAGGRYYHYSYDPIGQITVGTSSISSENRGYAYDAAWNLHYLTNNGVLNRLLVDNKNELTNAFGPAYGYDSNGNLTAGDDSHNAYVYDDENRLVQWFWYDTDSSHLTNGALRTDFFYDGIGRLRERVEYYVQGQATNPPPQFLFGPLAQQQPAWTFNYGILYLYDGWRVIQERDSNNVPLVSYTRGLDLSGSLEGAGGIGGLLARSSGYSSGNWTSHAYYHADGNGNITCLIASNQSEVAIYRYDPFGNTLSQSGTLADANVYRFSSKEIHTNSLMYYYGYRFYDPGLQRWINRDPMEQVSFRNAIWVRNGSFTFVDNDAIGAIDPLGLWHWYNPISWPIWDPVGEAVKYVAEPVGTGADAVKCAQGIYTGVVPGIKDRYRNFDSPLDAPWMPTYGPPPITNPPAPAVPPPPKPTGPLVPVLVPGFPVPPIYVDPTKGLITPPHHQAR
jgi:RHS repeat-associated protein